MSTLTIPAEANIQIPFLIEQQILKLLASDFKDFNSKNSYIRGFIS